jgi:hypothetical protein
METEYDLWCGSLVVSDHVFEKDGRRLCIHTVYLPGLRLGTAWSEVRKCMNGGTIRIWYAQKILSLQLVVIVKSEVSWWSLQSLTMMDFFTICKRRNRSLHWPFAKTNVPDRLTGLGEVGWAYDGVWHRSNGAILGHKPFFTYQESSRTYWIEETYTLFFIYDMLWMRCKDRVLLEIWRGIGYIEISCIVSQLYLLEKFSMDLKSHP